MANRSPRKKKVNPRQVAFTRFMFIVAVFAVWMLGISARLVHLQVTQHDWLREKAVDQRQDVKKSKLLRGTIYDRDNRPLAMSIRVRSLYADPTEIKDIDATAKVLARSLKLDAGQVSKALNEGKAAKKRFVPILKKLDEEAVQKINKTLVADNIQKADMPRFEGLHYSEDQTRSYPYGPMAAQVIGFSNQDDTGMAGIEQSQDDILHGAVIKKLQERDRLGRIYDETVFERERPGDISLTIAASYQFKADQALENGVKAANAKSGMAVVLSVKTGEILAMSNYPSFDPNSIKDAVPTSFTNHAIQSVYSPGSVMKLVTYSSGLEKNLFKPDDQIDAGNGTIEVANHKFTDSHHVGTVSYSQALAHSSNVCAIKTGLRVGKDDFYTMLQNMGFGTRTGVELPAETAGILRSPDKWNGDSLASMSIGYEIGVTALQMASAFATIANDGVKIQPRLIKEIRKPDQTPVASNNSPGVRVVSVETARNLRTMLRQVVLTGTGRRARLNGYTSAGKTGTAWKFDPVAKRVDPSKYISSFIGMAPADNPEIVIAVVIDEPKNGARDGGQVAAPVFKNIAEQLLPEMNVTPDGAEIKETQVAQEIPEIAPSKNSDTETTANRQGGKTTAVTPPKAAEPKKPVEVKKGSDKKQGNGKKILGNTTAVIGLTRKDQAELVES
ncbi:MAG: penicillin-binding protein 2 [Pyrinomonadaceae bacterium]|nr:penicillin-binding protein 2 [Pyrinomonadaceae bacterium]